jgi:hypothetical protein
MNQWYYLISDPGEVSKMNYTNIKKNSIKLNWEPSIIGETCLRNYTVKYINEQCYKNKGIVIHSKVHF